MKKTYSISEIGKLLGLGNDAIRFYEKKGLVHPQSNPQNQYRMYSFKNVLELLDVIYYRHLNLSISEIQQLSQQKDLSRMMEILDDKVEETKKRIFYEEQLLKKIEFVRQLVKNVDVETGKCSIREMPQLVVLAQSRHKEDFFFHHIRHLSVEQFVLCSLYGRYEVKNQMIEEQLTNVVLERSILDQLPMDVEINEDEILYEKKCIYLLFHMKQMKINEDDLKPIYDYAKRYQISLKDYFYVREIPMIFYDDEDHYYAQVFYPIEE